MSRTLHPGVEPAVAALGDALPEHPSPAEYADLIESLSNLTGPSLVATLGYLLEHLALQAAHLDGLTGGSRALIADHLTAAAALLGPVADRIDRPRALTGEWTR